MRARVFAALLALGWLLSLPSPVSLPGGAGMGGKAQAETVILTGPVVRFVDGDTVWVRLTDRVEKVRYIGIDTPEVHHPTRGEQPGGREATDVNRRLIGGKRCASSPTCSSATATGGS